MNKLKLSLLLLLISFSALSAQSKYHLGVNGVYVSSTGDLADLFDKGIGGLASLSYDVSDRIQLSVTTGYLKLSFNNDYINSQLKEAGINTTVDVDASMSIIPLMVGGKYFLSSSNFRPYVAADLGLHISKITSEKIIVGGQPFDAVASASETKAAFDFGIGFLYKIAPKINLDVNGKINLNGTEIKKESSFSSGNVTTTQSSESSASFFTISAGILFEL